MFGPRRVERVTSVAQVLGVAGLAMAAVLLAGCGAGAGSGASPELPSRTGTVETGGTAGVSPPTRTPPTRTPPTRTPAATLTVSASANTTQTQPPSTGGSSSAPTQASSDSSDVPTWVWWVLGALVASAGVAAPLLIRANRRRAWRADLAAAEREVGWFDRVLLTELQQAGSALEVRGGWAVGQTRVAAVEDRLTALADSARDDAGRTRAVELRNAV